uniref:PRANC domain-containing protein n=1 Tax=Trichogramma kaykai TaxID=54128 RepID=A0ABD2XCP1_9HYME
MDSYNVLFNKSINQQKLETLKKSRENINWKIENKRVEFLRQLDSLINGWDGPLPNLGDIFQWHEEIEFLLLDCIKIMRDNYYQAKRFIDFVIAMGYKNVPEIDNDGKPLMRRTTPVHLATRRWFVNRDQMIRELFKIYDANYIDEYGQTHFYVACSYGFDDIVEKFLDLGQDPNSVTETGGDSPLHLALPYFNERLVKLLLSRGTNPNLANAQGLTPLHILCMRNGVDENLLETFFKMCDGEHQTIQVNAQDKLGNTPLCTTLKSKNEKVAEFLLRRGSDPNLVDESGSTALHIICKSNKFFHNEEFLSKKFFKIMDDKQQTVHIDAKDNLGRTPLQWAVANVMPHAVNVLLKRGADLTNFTFPDTNYFAKRYDCSYGVSFYGRFMYTSKTLAIVECLEDAGFELEQDVALRISKFFAKHKMFQEKDLEKSWLENEKLASRAKKIIIKKNLSLYELIQLEPEESVKLVSTEDYAKLSTSRKFVNISEEHRENFAEHLCEKVARGFFRRLALYPFWEKVIRYRLPLECCEMILENLTNRDLCNIYLAANMSDSSSNKVSHS